MREPDPDTLTFFDGRRDAPELYRAAAVRTGPYPGRRTHHIVLSSPGEPDGELLARIRDAYAFAGAKRRRL